MHWSVLLCALVVAARVPGLGGLCVTVDMHGDEGGWGGAQLVLSELCGERRVLGALTTNSTHTVAELCASPEAGWEVVVTAPETVDAAAIAWALESGDGSVRLEGGAPFAHSLFGDCGGLCVRMRKRAACEVCVCAVCAEAEAEVLATCGDLASCTGGQALSKSDCCIALTNLNLANCTATSNTSLLPFSPTCHPSLHTPNDFFLAECAVKCVEGRKVGVGGRPQAPHGGLIVSPVCAATGRLLARPPDRPVDGVLACLTTIAGWNLTFDADAAFGKAWELREGDRLLAVLEAQDTTHLFASCSCPVSIREEILGACVVDGCPSTSPSAECCRALTQHLHFECGDDVGFGWDQSCAQGSLRVSELVPSVCQGCFAVNWTEPGTGTKFADCDGGAATSWKLGALDFYCTGGGLKACGLAKGARVTDLGTGEAWDEWGEGLRFYQCGDGPNDLRPVCGDFVVVGGVAWYKDLQVLDVASTDKWGDAVIDSTIALLPSLVTFNLSSVGLWEVASQVGLLQHLQHLELTGNALSEIPSQIGLAASLEHLWLSSNELVFVPSQLGQMGTTLRSMELDSNALSVVPSEFGLLENLRLFNLESNRLSRLPSELGQLRRLVSLGVQRNRLSDFPSELGNMQSLELLRLQENKLTTFPSEAGLLTSLIVVNLHSNALGRLPPELVAIHSIALLIASGNGISQDIAELQPFFDVQLSTGHFNRTIVLLDNYMYGCVDLSEAILQHSHLQRNCFSTCPRLSSSQRSATECLLTEVVSTPSARGNQSSVTFRFREKFPEYRIREGVEQDTRNLKWLYCVKPLDEHDCSYLTKDYEDSTVTLPDQEDGAFDFEVILVLYYRSIDKCREEVGELFGEVVSCDEEADTCSWLLSSLPVPIDCSFDDVRGRLEYFEFDVDTVPPSVSITARDASGAELSPGESVVQVDSIAFELRSSELATTFLFDARVVVTGCGTDPFIQQPAEDLMLVTCAKVDSDEVSVDVEGGSFVDQAGNGNNHAHFVVRIRECPEGYFQQIGDCASATLSSRCAPCVECQYPRLQTVECTPTSDTECSTTWFGLMPLWAGGLLAFVAVLFMKNAALFTRKRLFVAAFATFMGVADFFSDFYFVAFDTSGTMRVVALLFIVVPLAMNAVGVWTLHLVASQQNRIYHLTTRESPVASAIVMLISTSNPRLLGSWHGALGSDTHADVMRRLYVLSFVPAVIRDAPQLVLQGISLAGGLTGTAVMSVLLSSLSVLFAVALFFVQLRALATAHFHANKGSKAQSSLVSNLRSTSSRPRYPNELDLELQALRKENSELSELLQRYKTASGEVVRLVSLGNRHVGEDEEDDDEGDSEKMD